MPAPRPRLLLACLAPSFLAVCASAHAGDWPMHRADPERSGFTDEALPESLGLRWVHRPASPPQTAWPRSERMRFDRVFRVTIAGGIVCFGSSADGIVYALDAVTGEERWKFVTDAPIRFAPAASDGRFYVVSDDGFLYCLAAADGQLVWKKRGGPTGEMVLGNGRMVSSWPARGGPAIRDGIVYFAAGIWPSHGIYVHAVDAKTGDSVWTNDTAGGIHMSQPHGGAEADSGVAAQGYLVVTENYVLVPTGRAVPATFDRKDGKFLYYHLQKYGHAGGTNVVVSGDVFYNGGALYDLKTGHAHGKIGPGAIARLPGGMVHATQRGLVACRWIDRETVDDDGNTHKTRGLDPYLNADALHDDGAVIVAKGLAVVGGDGVVRTVDLESAATIWSADVEGRVHDLAVADSSLYVSTDAGPIYCFGETQDRRETPPARAGEVSVELATEPATQTPAARAADAILQKTGVTEGYCLDLGCGDGALAEELAKRSQLTIVAVDDDPTRVANARQRLMAAGLYGDRVTVLERPLAENGLPKYFADLIVSGRSVTDGSAAVDLSDVRRMQRPFGGIVCLGTLDSMTIDRRGPLDGTGTWTHQYADPANTVCSGDPLEGPLRPLWFRDVDQQMTQRHGRGPSPLFFQGRIFSEGLDSIVAIDAYNGRLLWEYALPGILRAYDGDHLMGTAGSHSNYCVDDNGVYVRTDDRCLRLDPATGKELGNFSMPPAAVRNVTEPEGDATAPRWGYVAAADGTLFGTRADPTHVVTYRYQPGGDLSAQLTESSALFALDAITGYVKWQYTAQDSIRHNAIAIGGGRVYLIDRPLAKFDQVKKADRNAKQPPGALIALDAASGEIVWRNDEAIFGTLLALDKKTGSLLMAYQPTRFRLASELGGRMAVFDTATGKRRWEAEAKYKSRPSIVGQTIYAEGGAWDVLTGETRPFNFRRSYGCGILASGQRMLVFRSATLAYFDLVTQDKIHNFGGIRPGCWINALPVGDLLLVPDASAGCQCSYQNRAWLALQGGG